MIRHFFEREGVGDEFEVGDGAADGNAHLMSVDEAGEKFVFGLKFVS